VLISVSIISAANLKNQKAFKWLIFGVAVMLPSAAIFLMKINLFQWFDKGDLSHVFMTVGIGLYYVGLQKINTEGKPFDLALNR
jgi:hypothetical protein